MITSRSIYRTVQRICAREMWRQIYPLNHGRSFRPVGRCVDCGSARSLVRDHRSYNDPHSVDTVCNRCNHLRGAAALELVDIESLRVVEILGGHRTPQWKRAA